ncbi:MAG: tetratricopeptide repeat protein [Myxococcota bacterium]
MRTPRTIFALSLGLLTVGAILFSRAAPEPALSGSVGSLAIATAALPGAEPTDREIARLQERVRTSPDSRAALERLGWTLVGKARETGDAGYYRLAEHAALALRDSDPLASTLLRGHVLHALHRFDEAERLARQLVGERGLAFDHGLLGDVLLDRGDVEGAIGAYQRMLDQRPDAHAQVRASRVRHLRGDVEGALEALRDAAQAVGIRSRESYAWIQSELALREFEAGDFSAALADLQAALEIVPSFPRALALEGRILLAEGRAADAVTPLREAAARTPFPDVLWTLVDALEAAGRSSEARATQARLLASGERVDPRGFALFLASRGLEPERAVGLARRELERRRDVYSFDALAWSELAAGDTAAARGHIRRALAEGTHDARLFLHAGVIAARSGAPAKASDWLTRARALEHTLLPSERALLDRQLASPSAEQS